jgi:hypothetical protein
MSETFLNMVMKRIVVTLKFFRGININILPSKLTTHVKEIMG